MHHPRGSTLEHNGTSEDGRGSGIVAKQQDSATVSASNVFCRTSSS